MSDENPTILVVNKPSRITVRRVLLLATIVTTAVVSAKLARSEVFATKVTEINEVITN